jgi:DNA mismatch endonuclease, patch repair protein
MSATKSKPNTLTVDPVRSRTMRAVKSRDTTPEMIVRRLVHAMGYRYRLHRKDLPGKPDLAFGPRRKVIFVNGCFWHGHDCKRGARTPKTNTEYWVAKINRNRARDAASTAALKQQGWQVLTVWECAVKDQDALAVELGTFLNG